MNLAGPKPWGIVWVTKDAVHRHEKKVSLYNFRAFLNELERLVKLENLVMNIQETHILPETCRGNWIWERLECLG